MVSRCTVFPKLTYSFCMIPFKTPAASLAEIHKLTLKFMRKCRGPIPIRFWGKAELEDSHVLISECATKLQESRQCGPGNGQIGKSRDWNHGSRNKPYVFSQRVIGKGAKTFHGERTVSSTGGAGNHTATCRRGPWTLPHATCTGQLRTSMRSVTCVQFSVLGTVLSLFRFLSPALLSTV